jgi:hypothetical protein
MNVILFFKSLKYRSETRKKKKTKYTISWQINIIKILLSDRTGQSESKSKFLLSQGQ